MRRLLSCLLVSALLTACSSPTKESAPAPPPAPEQQSQQPGKEALNEQAFAQIQKKNWAEAIRLAQQAVGLDPEYAQARYNLGLALYQAGRYQEASEHLNKAYGLNQTQVEPGWFLALTWEQLGQIDPAVALLKDLQKRFPDDKDVPQALQRLAAAAGVAVKVPGGGLRWVFLGDSMLVLDPGRRRGEIRGQDAQPLWSFDLAGDVVKTVPDQDGEQILVVLEDGRFQLVDLTKREVRAVTGIKVGADPGGKGGWFKLRRNLLYVGWDSWMGSQYSTTWWQAYRLVSQGGQMQAQSLGEPVSGSQDANAITIAPDGRTAAFGGSTAALYQDGRRIRPLEKGQRLTGKGDSLYWVDQGKTIVVETLDGKNLWTRPLPTGHTTVLSLLRTDDIWLLTRNGTAGYTVLRGEKETVFAADGHVTGVTLTALLIKRGSQTEAVDLSGKVVGTYPTGDPGIVPGGKWIYTNTKDGLKAWPMP